MNKRSNSKGLKVGHIREAVDKVYRSFDHFEGGIIHGSGNDTNA